MKKRLIGLVAVVGLALSSMLGLGVVAAVGEGHTPVHVCHWVPAHGGTFIHIVVDDDGADGNKALMAHLGHPNDQIGSESCGGED